MNTRVRLYDPPLEWCSILFVVPLGLFCLLHFYDPDPSFWGEMTFNGMHFIVNVFLLNTIHTLFTLKMILYFPELAPVRRRLLREGFVAALVIIIYLRWGQWLLVVNGWKGLSFIVFYLLNFHHGIKQVFGLGVIYDQLRLQHHPELASDFQKLRRREEALYWGLLLLAGANGIMYGFELDKAYPELLNALLIAGTGITIFILLINRKCHPLSESNKQLFLLRLVMVPISFVSIWGTVAISAYHGIDYYFFYRHTKANSGLKDEGAAWWFLIWAVPVIVLFLTTRQLGPFIAQTWGVPIKTQSWWQWIYVISVGTNFLHFFLDRRLFSMREKSIRETVGRLVVRPL